MIIGGQAVLLYGEPRMTRDIDITLGVGVEGLDQLITISNQLKLTVIPDHNVSEFVKKTMVLPVRDELTGIRIDFVFSFTPYEQQAIKRANSKKINRIKVCFASLEDLVIHKIIAHRPRDIEDVKLILLKNPNFDSGYIYQWLKEFDAGLEGSYSELFGKVIKDIQ